MVGRSVAPAPIARGSLGLSTKRTARMGDSETSGRNQRMADADLARAERHRKKWKTSAASADGAPLIDARTGQAMPSVGGGNFIDPATGTVMIGAAGGVINSRTGAFSPTAGGGGSHRSAPRREYIPPEPPTCAGQARELKRANDTLRSGYSSGNSAREQRRAIESWQRANGC